MNPHRWLRILATLLLLITLARMWSTRAAAAPDRLFLTEQRLETIREQLPESSAHLLSRATVGLGFALAYNWCYPAWTPDQRAYILARINVAPDAWPDFHHPNLGMTRGSNLHLPQIRRGGRNVRLRQNSQRAWIQHFIHHRRHRYRHILIR